jgi:DNA-binding response OmpR family regulator
MKTERVFKKILVVDDILYVVKSLAKVLSDEGYFVLTALSGNEALEKFSEHCPDAVTVDQRLPDMSGIQLAERIISLSGDARPRIIFISSVYDREEIAGIMKRGIDDYLMKPFTRAKLLETLGRLL